MTVCQNIRLGWISYAPVKRDFRVLPISNHKFFRDKGVDFCIGVISATDASNSSDKGYAKCRLRESESNTAQI